jgi:hypothetical protein
MYFRIPVFAVERQRYVRFLVVGVAANNIKVLWVVIKFQ